MAWYGAPVSSPYLGVKPRSGFRLIKTCANAMITFWETIYFRKFSTNKIHQGESWRCNHFWRHLQAQITKQLYSERDSKGSSLATSFSRQFTSEQHGQAKTGLLDRQNIYTKQKMVEKRGIYGSLYTKMKRILWGSWIWPLNIHPVIKWTPMSAINGRDVDCRSSKDFDSSCSVTAQSVFQLNAAVAG